MRGDWIQTYAGKKFSFKEPTLEMIDIEDIAHSLSNLCRFTGHCKQFYSVAQHSVLVSTYVHQALALMGLLHDSSEAYLNDISAPVKHTSIFDEYRKMEGNVQTLIYHKFGINSPEHALVKEADLRMLATEKRDLMNLEPEGWDLPYVPFADIIQPWEPSKAKEKFLERFNQLYKE